MTQKFCNKIYISSSIWGQVSHLADILSQNPEKLGQKRVVICEEKFTLTLEKLLGEKLGGIMTTRVLSFGKICDTLKARESYLSKTSEVMLLSKVISAVQSELDLFSDVASRPSFAGSIYDILSLLNSSNVDFDKLEKTNLPPALQKKITDICKINREYQSQKAGLFLDATDKMEALIAYFDSVDILRGAEVFLVGHTAFTNQMLAVVSKIAQSGKLSVYLTADMPRKGILSIFENAQHPFESVAIKEELSPLCQKALQGTAENFKREKTQLDLQGENLSLLEFDSDNFEVENITIKIKQLLANGEKPENISLVIADFENGLEKYADSFIKFDIPFFASKSETLEKFPFAKHILSLCDLTTKKYSLDCVADVLKSQFSPLPPEESYNFENFLIARNIDRGRFFKDEIFIKAELLQTRNDFLKATNIFEKGIFTAVEFSEIIKTYACENVNTLAHISAGLASFGSIDKADFSALSTKKTFEVLSEMELILGSDVFTLETLKNIFEGGLCGKEIATVPAHIHAVEISDPSSCIMLKKPYLFIVSAGKSTFPSSQKDTALLSDKDIFALSLGEIDVSPSVEFLNEKQTQICRLALLCGEKSLTLSFSKLSHGTKETPSDFFAMLEKYNCKYSPQGEYHFALETLGYTLEKALSSPQKAREVASVTLLQTLPTAQCAISLFAREHIKENTIAREISAGIYSAFKMLGQSEVLDGIAQKNHIEFVDAPIIRSEYSPSILESYFACPYACFLQGNINLRDREVGILKEFDTGNFLHELLEDFSQKMEDIKKEDITKEVADIAEKIQNSPAFDKFAGQDKFRFVFARLVREADKICHHIYKTNEISKFKPTMHEFTFGRDKKVVTDGGLSLTGKVDRVDTYGNDVLVVDYKTGHIDLTDSAFYHGLKLQSELYLYAVSSLTHKNPVGAVYLPISDNFDKKPLSYKMKGKILKDGEFLKNLDTTVNAGESSEVYPFALKIDGTSVASSSNLENQQFEEHIKKAIKTAEQGKVEMEQGYIFPSPYVDSSKNSCKFCKFVSICKTCGENNTRGGSLEKEKGND
ncbi:MAG: PD-(D/E)XK nuclease family protein [Bacillota bacterium]